MEKSRPYRVEKTIYMPLLREGTECWRPVHAEQIGADTFEVTDNIPEDESWAFAPFSRVRCRDKVFADGHIGLVVSAYAIESNPFYRLLKDNEGRLFRIGFISAEEVVVKVTHVDEEREDFIYDLLSTNRGSKYRDMPKNTAYSAKFADLVSVRLEE